MIIILIKNVCSFLFIWEVKRQGKFFCFVKSPKKRGVFKISWHNAKKRRWEEVNKRCERCGRILELNWCKGHHKKNRKNGGKSEYENCEIRCSRCESICHDIDKYGNPSAEKFRKALRGESVAKNYSYSRRKKQYRYRIFVGCRGARVR